LEEQLKKNLAAYNNLEILKGYILERRADLTLFGGAASGLNSERLADRIYLYNEAIKIGTEIEPQRSVYEKSQIRWKQAILYSLQGDIEQAETLLKDNPSHETHPFKLVHQLAEAVLFYYKSIEGRSEGVADRNRELRMFQRRFAPQNNATLEMAAQPEILELVLFSMEFLINDSIKHEDWETLGDYVLAYQLAIGGFLRQYPGATPFMRRYHELLVRSAVILHNNLERTRDKQTQIRNIMRILNPMRPFVKEGGPGGTEMPTLLLFFLPENNKAEEGFVVFFPQDDREGALYPLPLTRQMIKQNEGRRLPPLDAQLLEQIAAEKASGRKIRISWDDTPAWSRKEDALTEAEYPYKDVLPLR
jgi:hypothetical protein